MRVKTSRLSTTQITRQYVLDLISTAREQQKLGPTALERKAGIPKDTIRDFERGKAYLIRADKLQKILNALGYQLSITKLTISVLTFAYLLNAAAAQALVFHKGTSILGHATIEAALSLDSHKIIPYIIGESSSCT